MSRRRPERSEARVQDDLRRKGIQARGATFKALAPDVQERISPVIDQLAKNPRPHGSKMLRGHDRIMRIRVGDYRIVYQIQEASVIVVILVIGHRREIYRLVERLT